MNLEVVKRVHPCAWLLSSSTKCRWCELLHHVRLEGTSRTLCGHECILDWMPLVDTHPEDISALDRCMVCYARLPEREVIL